MKNNLTDKTKPTSNAARFEQPPTLVLKNQPPGYRFQTKSYDTRQIIHVQKGSLIMNENNKRHELGPGQTLLLFPRTRFQLCCKNEGYEGIGILNASVLVAPEDALSPLAMPADTGLSDLFARVLAEVRQNANQHGLALAATRFLEATINIRLKALLVSEQVSLNDWLLRAAELLAQSTHERVRLRELLSGIPVSYAHLGRAFHRKCGIGLKQFFIRQKIAEAKRLLESGKMSVTDISYELGFASSQHFATCFKTIAGLTPSKWTAREKNLMHS